VAAGCTVTMPLQDQFWGDRYGAVADPYGPPWEWRGPTGTAEGSATLIANMAGRGDRSARSPVARSAVCLLQEHPAG